MTATVTVANLSIRAGGGRQMAVDGFHVIMFRGLRLSYMIMMIMMAMHRG